MSLIPTPSASNARLAVLAGALLACAGPAAAEGARTAETVLSAESERGRAFQERYGYSDAVVAGDTIYLSGIVVGMRPGETDMVAAYDRVYRLIGTILERAGASFDDVVDITSFHTDVEAQIEPMSTAHKRHVKAPWPAWTAIGVSRLLGGGITEIKVVARRSRAAAASQ